MCRLWVCLCTSTLPRPALLGFITTLYHNLRWSITYPSSNTLSQSIMLTSLIVLYHANGYNNEGGSPRKLTRWHGDVMPGCHGDVMTDCHGDVMTDCHDDTMTGCHDDTMTGCHDNRSMSWWQDDHSPIPAGETEEDNIDNRSVRIKQSRSNNVRHGRNCKVQILSWHQTKCKMNRGGV